MPPTEEPPQLRIRSQAEMAQLTPYLLGFTPEESLVIAVIQEGRIQVTARVDIADIQPAGAAEALLDRIWARFPAADAYLTAYTGDHNAGWDILDRCADHLPETSMRQAMLIDGDTWHLADGQAGQIDPAGALALEASYHGLQRLDRREDLVAGFASAPDSDELDGTVGAALDKLPPPGDTNAIITRMRDLLGRDLPGEPPPPDEHGIVPPTARVDVEDAIQLAVLVQNPAARDIALLSMTRDNGPRHLQLWRDVVNSVPAYGADLPLFLAGMAAWVSGDGASASIALDRAIETAERPLHEHPAGLLDQLIDQVVPPSAWEPLRADVLAHADPRVRAAVNGTPPPNGHRVDTVAAPTDPPAPVPPLGEPTRRPGYGI